MGRVNVTLEGRRLLANRLVAGVAGLSHHRFLFPNLYINVLI